MNQEKSTRTTVSVVLSSLLHGSAITLIALGPTFIPGLDGAGDRDSSVDTTESSTVEFTLSGDASVSDIKPVQQPLIQPVASPIAVEETPVIVKPEPKPEKIAKSAEAKPLPQKKSLPEKIEPASALPVKEETVAQENPSTVEESPVVTETPIDEPIQTAEKEASPIENEPTPEEKTESVAAAAVTTNEVTEEPIEQAEQKVEDKEFAEDQVPLPPPQPKISEQTIAKEQAAENATQAGTAQDAQNGQGGRNASPISVTQNYLGLKQVPGNRPPQYSDRMRLSKMQGRGQIVYLVKKDGTVGDVRLVKSTGYPDLDVAAVQAFSKYKFVPGQEGYTLHEFEFSLKGPEQSAAGRLRTTMNR